MTDYNVCPENDDGVHGPLRAHLDVPISDSHVSVECEACGETTGHPIAAFAADLEWN